MHLKLTTARVSGLDYLLGDKSASGELRLAEPEVVQGEIWPIEALNTQNHKSRFLVGNLSWSESLEEIERETLGEVIKDLEDVITRGIPAEARASALWVLHQRKTGTDVHFCIAQVHLPSGRPMSLVHFRNCRKLLQCWTDIWNLRKRWTSPYDGSADFMLPHPLDAGTGSEVKKRWRRIDNSIQYLVSSGQVASREEIVEKFGEYGVRVERESSVGISVRMRGGEVLPYEGGKYSSDFRFATVRRRIEVNRMQWWREAPQRLPKLESDFCRLLKKREKRAAKDFGDCSLKAHPIHNGELIRESKMDDDSSRVKPGEFDEREWVSSTCLSHSQFGDKLARFHDERGEQDAPRESIELSSEKLLKGATISYSVSTVNLQHSNEPSTKEGEKETNHPLARLLEAFAGGLTGLYKKRREWIQTIQRNLDRFAATAAGMSRVAEEILGSDRQHPATDREIGSSHRETRTSEWGYGSQPKGGSGDQPDFSFGGVVLQRAPVPPEGLRTPAEELRAAIEREERLNRDKLRAAKLIDDINHLRDDVDWDR